MDLVIQLKIHGQVVVQYLTSSVATRLGVHSLYFTIYIIIDFISKIRLKMDDYPDLDDYYEEDYSKYEDKYADDLDMMDDMQQGRWRIAFLAIDMCQMDNIGLFVYFG